MYRTKITLNTRTVQNIKKIKTRMVQKKKKH